MNSPDPGLETLLELDGSVLEQEGGFWIKIEARQVPPSPHALSGIREPHAARSVWNTGPRLRQRTAVKPPKKFKFAGQRLPYDHRHRSASDKGVPYAFESAQRLLQDFFAEVDRVIKEAQQ